MKKVILNIFLLFFIAACEKKKPGPVKKTPVSPTPDLVFCANAVYDSIEDIPNYILSYWCYEEDFFSDVNLRVRFGQTMWLLSNDCNDSKQIYSDELIDKNANDYYLYIVDENNKKEDFNISIKNSISSNNTRNLIFWNVYEKFILYNWNTCYDDIVIPKGYFTEKEGEIYLSVFEKNKTSHEEKSLVTVTIKYTNDGEIIKLIAPEKSFSGKGLKEGKTEEEIFREV